MKHSRRSFIRNTAGAFAAFTIIPRKVLGRGYTAPSDQLTKAVIGVGEMGKNHFAYGGTRVVAICDVDRTHLAAAKALLGQGVKTFDDYRKVVQLPEADIIHIATPPHWHSLITMAAASAGKDIWCETPMARTIGESKRMMETVQQYGRMFRLNTSWRLDNPKIRKAKKLVSSGLLGWPVSLTIGKGTGFEWSANWTGKTNLPVMPVPATLNYDRWLGPAPYKPYHPHRVHQTFRGYWDYDGGTLGDTGQQYLDAVQYILGKDNTSPVSVEIDAPLQHPDAVGTWKRITYTYDDGCQVVLDNDGDVWIEGPKGKVYPDFRSDIADLEKRLAPYPEPLTEQADFNTSVRLRQPFAINEANGHRSCTLVNMAKIALQVGRTLEFDPVKQRFAYDDGANALIDPPMRAPWNLQA